MFLGGKITPGHFIVQELAPAPPVLRFANPSPPPDHLYVIVKVKFH